MRDKLALREVFEEHEIDGVMHFAGFKAVGESVKSPSEYYSNNLGCTFTLIEIMCEFNCKTIVFSSSATVYGDPKFVPIKENAPLNATNPYGRTKLFIENYLNDIYMADNDWKIVILRYFNPVGAHQSGLIGENPNDIPNNLMPYLSQVAIGKLERLNIFGNDYSTKDGTGVRDYIHVVDLAQGHVSAFNILRDSPQFLILNLGTGKGYTVLEMVHAFEETIGQSIPYKITKRRPGDVKECYADASLAQEKLKWKPRYKIKDMCADTWRWQFNNPNGFE